MRKYILILLIIIQALALMYFCKLTITKIGINEIIPGVANFIMFHLPNDFKSVSSIISECRKKGLYLRDVSGMGTSIGTNAMRMAVKDSATNKRMMEIFTTAVN